MAKIADDLNDGVLIDVAIARAHDFFKEEYIEDIHPVLRLTDSVVPYDNGGYLPAGMSFAYNASGVAEPVLTKKQQWPGWERDLGLVGAYKEILGTAFKNADLKADDIRKAAATGKMFVSSATLRGLIAEEVHTTFLDALTPLWGEAWHLGYQSGKALVTGQDAIFTAKVSSDALDSFIATEGTHWLDQIARTGLHGANARAEVIARSEVARAMNAGAIAAYRDNGVTHKHLLVAPNDTCDVCKAARKQGVIPLDSIFPAGGLGGPFHPQCRCVPAPVNVDVEPPQAHLGKAEDHSLVAFILFRSTDAGREVFLLQKRGSDMNNPGTWCLPGGTSHTGESPWECAYRESCEEMGDLPACNPTVHFMQVENKRTIHIFMCDVPEIFTPHMDGDTQFETAGYGWFSRKEIKKLPLQPNFAEQWKNIKWDEVAKFIANTESGEMLVGVDEDQPLFPAGARWPYPRRSDGAEDPHYGTAATDAFPSRNPARNTPAAHGPVDGADVVGGNTRVYAPDGDETAEQPKKRGRSG